MPALRSQLLALAEQLRSDPSLPTVVVGFDGYIDSIKRVVRQRSQDQIAYFETMPELATRIEYAAGKSAQLEVVPVTTKAGGNAPIMAHTLTRMGFGVHGIGPLGEPAIHEAFADLAKQARLYSLGPPADTTAWEFQDGKLILSDLSAFADLNWSLLQSNIGLQTLGTAFGQADLIAQVGLVNLPHARSLLHDICIQLMPRLPQRPRKLFFDLADPTRMVDDALRAIVDTIGSYRPYGSVTLGLNENEALHLYKVYLGQDGANMELEELSQALYKPLPVDQLMIHPVDRALLITEQHLETVPGRLVAQPKILTGGGDNFNAGYCLGWALDLPPAQCLLLGVATSGAYISQGASPDLAAISAYLERWGAEQ